MMLRFLVVLLVMVACCSMIAAFGLADAGHYGWAMIGAAITLIACRMAAIFDKAHSDYW